MLWILSLCSNKLPVLWNLSVYQDKGTVKLYFDNLKGPRNIIPNYNPLKVNIFLLKQSILRDNFKHIQFPLIVRNLVSDNNKILYFFACCKE